MNRVSIAIAALLITAPAFAQNTPPATPSPATTPPAASSQNDNLFYSHQANEMRASKLIGATVRNANESIGEINELILDKDGKIAAVVVGVGGFLGIGEREVALDYKSLTIKRDPNAMTEAGATTVMVNATKDGLKAAPAWTWNRDTNPGATAPRTTTPSGPTR
jgi:hypothetical protein